MASDAKIAANRRNGRKSRGPKTASGKARSSCNALRHGLAAVTRGHLAHTEEITRLAKAIMGSATHPLLYERALVIAECDVLLRCVRTEQLAVIERLRDASARPLAEGDDRLARAREISRAYRHRYALEKVANAKYFALSEEEQDKIWEGDEPSALAVLPPPVRERDESAMMCVAMPDLRRLLRYERRAWSRRKKAMRKYLAIRCRFKPTEQWSVADDRFFRLFPEESANEKK